MPHTSYIRPALRLLDLSSMRNPDMADGPESLRGFNKLCKRESTYSKFVIVQQMSNKIIPPDIHSATHLLRNVVNILLHLGRMDTARDH